MTGRPRLLLEVRTTLLLLAGGAGFTFLSFWYRYMDVLARGGDEPLRVKLIEEATGIFGAILLLLPVIWLTRYLLWRGARWEVQVLIHLPVLAAFAVAHTSLLWTSRSVIFPLAGLGAYDYGEMPMRYLMELGIQIPVYLLFVGGTLAVEHLRASRERDLRLGRLEAELARARLANLEHRLRPHFLFNALNTVSSVMYEDRDRADRILADLAEFLRRSLRTSEAQEVSLREELENLELFLTVARARFEERLDVRVEVSEEALGAAVPSLLLQPLVENALQHGDPGDELPACIRLEAGVEAGKLVLRVSDNGPGADASLEELSERGIGLGTTLRRLDLLYGDAHRVEGRNLPGGGFLLRLELPLRPAGEAARNT